MHLANLGILICRFSKVKLHPFLISPTTGNGKRDRNQGACTRLAAGERGFWNPQTQPFRLLWLTVRSAYGEDVWGSADLLTISWVKIIIVHCPCWLHFLETFIVGLLSPSVFSSAHCLCVEEVTLGLAGQRNLLWTGVPLHGTIQAQQKTE